MGSCSHDNLVRAHTALVIGDTPVAKRVCGMLALACGAEHVLHLVAPGDDELTAALRTPVAFATVLIRDDVAALRYALALAHLAPKLPIAVTVFDRTIAEQLQVLLPHAVVASSASAAVPSLLGPCLDADLVAALTDGESRVEIAAGSGSTAFSERRVEVSRPALPRRVSGWLSVDHRHQDPGTRLLLKGLLGLGLVLFGDWLWLVLVAGHAPAAALSEAARVLATVGPAPEHASGVYGVLSAMAMLGTIVLTALFTAGLVDRLLEPRLVRLAGSGAVPRSKHVIVVGLGQVGVRLCESLREHGIRVVALERDRKAAGVVLARQLRIPVVIGDGTSRHFLQRLRLERCAAVAAVSSNDLNNIAVAVAVSAISPSTRVVMRAGEQEAVSETRSLLPLGITRDVTALGAAYVVARLNDAASGAVVLTDAEQAHVRSEGGQYQRLPLAPRDDCAHVDLRGDPHTRQAIGMRNALPR